MCNVNVFAVCGLDMSTPKRISNVDVVKTVDPKNETTVIKSAELLNDDGSESVIPTGTTSIKIDLKEKSYLFSIQVVPSTVSDNTKGIEEVKIDDVPITATGEVS